MKIAAIASAAGFLLSVILIVGIGGAALPNVAMGSVASIELAAVTFVTTLFWSLERKLTHVFTTTLPPRPN